MERTYKTYWKWNCQKYRYIIYTKTLFRWKSLAMSLLLIYIHSYLNYANTAWCSTNRTYLKKLQSQRKRAIRIIFYESKFAHTQEYFKENNVLNIYQLNIFNNLLFLHRVKNGKVSSVSLSIFLRPLHHYPTSFSQIIILYLPLS